MEVDNIIKILRDVLGEIVYRNYPAKFWLLINCPFHNDKNPSFRINYSSGYCECMAGCYKGNFIDFISKLTNKDKLVVEKYLITNNVMFNLGLKKKKEFNNKKSFEELYFSNNIKVDIDLSIYDKEYTNIKEYWEKRGFNEDDYKKFAGKIFYDKWNNSILFNCEYGVLVKYIESNDWVFMSGSDKSKCLWKYIKGSNNVILCEGIFDVLSLSKLFTNSDIIGILGNSLSDYKLKYIERNWSNIMFAFDNDEGGLIAFKKSYNYFAGKNKNLYFLNYKEKDPNELFLKQNKIYSVKLLQN